MGKRQGEYYWTGGRGRGGGTGKEECDREGKEERGSEWKGGKGEKGERGGG
jgi:hypothetical protein